MWKLEKLGHTKINNNINNNIILLQICLQKTCHLLLIYSFFSFHSCKAALQVKGDTKAVRQGTDSSLTGPTCRKSKLSVFIYTCSLQTFMLSSGKTCEIRAPSGCTLLLTSRFNFTPPSTKSLHPVTSVLQVGVTGRQKDRRAERQVHRRSDSHLPEDFLWWVFSDLYPDCVLKFVRSQSLL